MAKYEDLAFCLRQAIEYILEQSRDANKDALAEDDNYNKGVAMGLYRALSAIKMEAELLELDLEGLGLDFDVGAMLFSKPEDG